MLSLLTSVAQQVPAPQEMQSHPSVWRFPRHAPFCARGRPGVARRLLTYNERSSSPAQGIADAPSHQDADDSSVEPLIGTYTIHPARFLETGTVPLEFPFYNPSFRKGEPDAAVDLEEAKLELRQQPRALVGSPEILNFQSQVLEAHATPDLCQIGRFTSSSCPWHLLLRLPSCSQSDLLHST